MKIRRYLTAARGRVTHARAPSMHGLLIGQNHILVGVITGGWGVS
jgi:hypothetical protein